MLRTISPALRFSSAVAISEFKEDGRSRQQRFVVLPGQYPQNFLVWRQAPAMGWVGEFDEITALEEELESHKDQPLNAETAGRWLESARQAILKGLTTGNQNKAWFAQHWGEELQETVDTLKGDDLEGFVRLDPQRQTYNLELVKKGTPRHGQLSSSPSVVERRSFDAIA